VTDAIVVILAGGEASRLPGKLERPVDGTPLLLQVYRNVRGRWPVYVSGRGSFSPDIDAELDCPVIVDRWTRRGPLGGLMSVLTEVNAGRVFVAAGDAPRLTTEVFDRLAAAWRAGDEAVVPEHDGLLEPLAAFYDRAAVLREGAIVLSTRKPSMHALLERLRVRRISLPAHWFLNINTAADIAAMQRQEGHTNT